MKTNAISRKGLPQINHMFCKDKKYRYKQNNKENALQQDLDTIIHSLANHESPILTKFSKHINYINNKVSQSHKKYVQTLQYLPRVKHHEEIKGIKGQMVGYLRKMSQGHRSEQSDYAEFMRLSLQSQDYLQFYLKNRFKSEDDFGMVHSKQKSITLSILKNNYKCLTQNSPFIANRIILSLNMNPLNDFHFIDWNTFCKFRRLALAKLSPLEGRNFLVDYFFIHHRQLSKLQFRLIVKSILGKLQKMISLSNIQQWLQRIMSYGDSFLPELLTRQSLYKIIVNQHLFIWSELIQLIFLV